MVYQFRNEIMLPVDANSIVIQQMPTFYQEEFSATQRNTGLISMFFVSFIQHIFDYNIFILVVIFAVDPLTNMVYR